MIRKPSERVKGNGEAGEAKVYIREGKLEAAGAWVVQQTRARGDLRVLCPEAPRVRSLVGAIKARGTQGFLPYLPASGRVSC